MFTNSMGVDWRSVSLGLVMPFHTVDYICACKNVEAWQDLMHGQGRRGCKNLSLQHSTEGGRIHHGWLGHRSIDIHCTQTLKHIYRKCSLKSVRKPHKLDETMKTLHRH